MEHRLSGVKVYIDLLFQVNITPGTGVPILWENGAEVLLFGRWACPFTVRVHIALKLKGIDCMSMSRTKI